MMFFSRALVFILLCPMHVFSAEITPIYQLSETAYPLSEEADTYLQVPLSQDIYRYSQYADLRDLVVVDADNNTIPYRVVSLAPSPATSIETQKSITTLEFYPVTANTTPAAMRALRTTHINITDNNVRVDINAEGKESVTKNHTPDFYLIAVSNVKTTISVLQIDWVANEKNQYLEVEVEASRNLQKWESLGRSTLVHIIQQDQQLKRNHIDVNIAPHTYKFLRLKIVQGGDALQISGVTALQRMHDFKTETVVQESWALKGVLANTQTNVYFPHEHSKTYPVVAWEYERNETTPIETLSVNFGENNYGDSLHILSRSSEKQNWQLHHQGIWFNAQVGNQWQTSDPIAVYRNSDKFWRIELIQSTKNSVKPELVFSWQPTQLQIITNNKPPYSLAISSQNTSYQSHQVFNQLLEKTKPIWIKASVVSLNANPLDVKVSAAKKVDWHKYLFWAFLVVALMLLIVFALRLFKQVNQNLT